MVGVVGCVDESSERAEALERKQQYVAVLREAKARTETILAEKMKGTDKDTFCSLMKSPSARSRLVGEISAKSGESREETEKCFDYMADIVCEDLLGQIINGIEGGYLVKGMPMEAIECVLGRRNLEKQAEHADGTALYELQGDSQIRGGRFYLVYYTLWLKDGRLQDWTTHYRTP